MSVTVALYIILGIAALIAAILSVRIVITIAYTDKMTLSVKLLGKSFQLRPKRQKKYRLSRYTLKKIARRDRARAKRRDERNRRLIKRAKFSHEQKNAGRTVLGESVPDVLRLLVSTLKFFFPALFFRLHFRVSRVKIKVGGPDAASIALSYYAISNALAPVLIFIDRHSHLHGVNRAEIDISPDYLSERIEADVKLSFSISLGALIGLIVRTAYRAVTRYNDIKSSKQEKNTAGNKQNEKTKPTAAQSAGKTA